MKIFTLLIAATVLHPAHDSPNGKKEEVVVPHAGFYATYEDCDKHAKHYEELVGVNGRLPYTILDRCTAREVGEDRKILSGIASPYW